MFMHKAVRNEPLKSFQFDVHIGIMHQDRESSHLQVMCLQPLTFELGTPSPNVLGARSLLSSRTTLKLVRTACQKDVTILAGAVVLIV